MILPALSSEKVRRSLETGTFFWVLARGGHDDPALPVITRIRVDTHNGVIRIAVSGHEPVNWISEGRLVHQGDQANLGELSDVGRYVGAETYAADGAVVGTQPFINDRP